jgi:hypothetical protein
MEEEANVIIEITCFPILKRRFVGFELFYSFLRKYEEQNQ